MTHWTGMEICCRRALIYAVFHCDSGYILALRRPKTQAIIIERLSAVMCRLVRQLIRPVISPTCPTGVRRTSCAPVTTAHFTLRVVTLLWSTVTQLTSRDSGLVKCESVVMLTVRIGIPRWWLQMLRLNDMLAGSVQMLGVSYRLQSQGSSMNLTLGLWGNFPPLNIRGRKKWAALSTLNFWYFLVRVATSTY